MEKNTGGFAFPTDYETHPGQACNEFRHAEGMTLRDYFAAKAMAACIGADSHANQNYSAEPAKVAAYAYEFADALLVEREK